MTSCTKRTERCANDEKLRHYADMRITLELDDGVRVNAVDSVNCWLK